MASIVKVFTKEEVEFIYSKLTNEGFTKEEIIKVLECKRYKNYHITSLNSKTKVVDFSHLLRKLYLLNYETKEVTTLLGEPLYKVMSSYLEKLIFDDTLLEREQKKKQELMDIKAIFGID